MISDIRASRWLCRCALLLGLFCALAAPTWALARVGGGEHYDTGRIFSSPDGDGDGDVFGLLVWFAFERPAIGIPLLVVVAMGYVYMKRNGPTARTQRAFEEREVQIRPPVTATQISSWVAALKEKDPAFQLAPFLDRVKRLFIDVQGAWFRRHLEPVRPFLSDATFQRLSTQLSLLSLMGVRDALADLEVLELKLVGFEQNRWFDTVHVRIHARARDTDVPATYTDEQASAAAQKVAPETFTEIWSFVRKMGTQTRIGEDLYQGKCPNCGAPYQGGATNVCEYCQAVVNSGNYDWTLAEITQAIEFTPASGPVQGLQAARERDEALALELLEDRASLLFWKWIDAQSRLDARCMAKLATREWLDGFRAELDGLRAQGRRKVFLECAVGAVTTRAIDLDGERERAHIEIRWSARMGIGPANERPPPLPTIPHRWVFTLVRKAGATTNTANGLATSRCGGCNAPLTDSASSRCDFCGLELSAGERDWVLSWCGTYEAYRATVAPSSGPSGAEVVTDRTERERLLYLMAAMAASDGQVDARERKLLRLCAERWSVSFENVEMALNVGPGLFDRLVAKQSPEAVALMRHLVQMAMVDGRVDRRERELLERAANHLGLGGRLSELLKPVG